MSNHSEDALNSTQLEESEDPFNYDVFKTPWQIGIAVSAVCLSMQMFILLLIPNSRKYDEKVLLQMTVARLVNTVCEYCVCYVYFEVEILRYVVFASYVHAEFALVTWMFVFTKNLYDKVVLVFVYEKLNLLIVSVLVWTLTMPVGVLCPVLLKINRNYFKIYYTVYAHVKFFTLTLNAVIFVEIFYVAVRIGKDRINSIIHFIKTSIIAFSLVCITSLQVLVTDLLSYFIGENVPLQYTFCAINSYQVIAITVIFVILANNKISDSVLIAISLKLKKLLSR